MKKILLSLVGSQTGRPYRIVKDQHGIGVEEADDRFFYHDCGPEFSDLEAAKTYIQKRDVDADYERAERKLGL